MDIRKIRKQLGLSQRQLCNLINEKKIKGFKNNGILSRMETKKMEVPLEIEKILAELLNNDEAQRLNNIKENIEYRELEKKNNLDFLNSLILDNNNNNSEIKKLIEKINK